MAPESSNLSAPTMAKNVKGKLYMMSDLQGGWVEVDKPKKDYDFKLNISADTSKLMDSIKSATESIQDLGETWQAVSGSIGTSGIKYWGGEPVYTTTPYWYDEPVYKPVNKPVPISTPVVEAEYDESLHTLVMKVSVAVSEYELDQYKGCTTALGEDIGDRMKKQVVNLLLERNKEQKEKGA